jgi:endonuclease YncB( thermonuclease family)
MYHISLILFYLFFQGNEFQAKVTTVEDGDTFEVVANEKKYVVRLQSIDCPEDGQAFSAKAKQFVDALCRNKIVTVRNNTIDPRGRIIAEVILPDGRSVSKELLKAGYAWHFKRYSQDKELAALEEEAKKQKKGLWIEENPIAPWDYKKSKGQ